MAACIAAANAGRSGPGLWVSIQVTQLSSEPCVRAYSSPSRSVKSPPPRSARLYFIMNESIAFGELVETWSGVRSTAGRLEKRARMAALFARLGAEDLPLAASWLAGEIRQGALQVGWRTLEAAGKPVRDTDLPLFAATAPAASAHRTSDGDSPLRISDVDTAFEKLQHVGGAGSEPRRIALLAALFERATDSEREAATAKWKEWWTAEKARLAKEEAKKERRKGD